VLVLDFAAGADPKERVPMMAADALPDDFTGCLRRLAHVDKPVVARSRAGRWAAAASWGAC
jgi:enoyl-CoA hydratase/carnithine racemase